MIGFTYLHLCLFIYFSGRGDRLCVIRNHARWMIQRPRLTDKSWHLMYVAVGQSPPGPFPGVNSQLECQKQYTSLSSLFFPCSLRRHTFQALKRSPKRNLFCLFVLHSKGSYRELALWLLLKMLTLLCCNTDTGSARWAHREPVAC